MPLRRGTIHVIGPGTPSLNPPRRAIARCARCRGRHAASYAGRVQFGPRLTRSFFDRPCAEVAPPVLELSRSRLREAITEKYRTGLDMELDPVGVAAAVLARYLADTAGYRIVAVFYAGGHHHLYGFRATLPVDSILEDLRATTSGSLFRPYLTLRKSRE